MVMSKGEKIGLTGSCSLLPFATKLQQGYVFTGVCDSVHRRASMSGGCAWQGACMVGVCVVGGMPGRGACMVQRAVRILLECILVIVN